MTVPNVAYLVPDVQGLMRGKEHCRCGGAFGLTERIVHKIAAFDFDGTVISGNSPVLLVRYLLKRKMISVSVCMRLLSWGLAYKLHLPQKESHARSLVFTAFKGLPKDQVDAFLERFCDDVILDGGRIRAQALERMNQLKREGYEIAVISATFGPIARRALLVLPADHAICTEMMVDQTGCYTNQVQGDCIEGEAKVASCVSYFDEVYGPGAWTLEYSFGDHSSDRNILGYARHAVAVSPDWLLTLIAHRKGWRIEDWNNPVNK